MKRSHEVALWSGLAAFFGSLLAIGIFDILNPDQWQEYLGALIVAAITAGAVYAKQRLEDEKKGRLHGGKIIVTDVGDKKVFSLEVDEDPEVLEHGSEVVFKVEKGSGA